MSHLVVKSHTTEIDFTREQVDLIKSTVAKGATDAELRLFLYRAKNMGFDPLKPGQIHFVKYGNNPGSVVVGIDGMRTRAANTGKHDGTERGVIYDENGKLKKGWARVHRKDRAVPIYEEVLLSEYDTGKAQWAKMKETMIKKVAEAAALRIAFPDELGGVYVEEEFNQQGERDAKAKELTAKVQESEAAPEFEAADYFNEPEETPADDLGEYVVKVGKKHKDKKLKDIPLDEMKSFCDWVDQQENPHKSVKECKEMMRQYLEAMG